MPDLAARRRRPAPALPPRPLRGMTPAAARAGRMADSAVRAAPGARRRRTARNRGALPPRGIPVEARNARARQQIAHGGLDTLRADSEGPDPGSGAARAALGSPSLEAAVVAQQPAVSGPVQGQRHVTARAVRHEAAV